MVFGPNSYFASPFFPTQHSTYPNPMSILSPAIKGYMRLRQSAIDNFMLNPLDTQMKVFNELLGSAQYTEYGKAHGFSRINSISDFKRAVPLNDYETVKPYIERILNGEQNLLWPSDVSWFAKSSGTTSDKSKFIPITKENLDDNHYRAGKDVLALYLHQFPESKIMSGKGLVLGGSHQVNTLADESFYGDLSAVTMQNMPLMGQLLRTPDLSIALMDEWEEKIEAMAQATIKENVTFIAGVPTWTIVLIKRIFEIAGTQNLLDVWPNLELYIHGGVSFKPYRETFKKYIPSSQMQYLETYNASEGFFAAQDECDNEGMLLLLNHGIFYEFLPMDQLDLEGSETIQLEEVVTGVNYAIVISTNTGLWRYQVGDTIQFTSLKPYRIKVSGRIKFFMNAFGEEVIVDNSDAALAEACRQTGAVINDYTAAPVYMTGEQNGAHEWIIEFEQLPCPLAEFVSSMDKSLQAINSDYEAKRYKDIALRMPIVHQMPKGGFNLWLKSRGKLGGQHKVPRLSNERKWLEDILPFTHSIVA